MHGAAHSLGGSSYIIIQTISHIHAHRPMQSQWWLSLKLSSQLILGCVKHLKLAVTILQLGERIEGEEWNIRSKCLTL